MNWDQLEGQWQQLRGSVREKWGKLTDDDLNAIAGKRDKLIGKLQERYGYLKEKAVEEADAYLRSADRLASAARK